MHSESACVYLLMCVLVKECLVKYNGNIQCTSSRQKPAETPLIVEKMIINSLVGTYDEHLTTLIQNLALSTVTSTVCKLSLPSI